MMEIPKFLIKITDKEYFAAKEYLRAGQLKKFRKSPTIYDVTSVIRIVGLCRNRKVWLAWKLPCHLAIHSREGSVPKSAGPHWRSRRAGE